MFFIFLYVLRSDYFRNFVDSCLQKIAQDRPTSDVLLKVRGLKILLDVVCFEILFIRLENQKLFSEDLFILKSFSIFK